MNNAEMVNVWLRYQQRERMRSNTTLYSYRRDCIRFIEAMGEARPFNTVTTNDLREWVYAPLEKGKRKGLAPSAATTKRRVSMLRSLFGFLHAEALVPLNPALRLVAPTVHNENPKPVSMDMWVELWRSGLSDLQRTQFGLAMFCGLRRSEVVRISNDHVQGPMLRGFKRKGGKTGVVPWQSAVLLYAREYPHLLAGDPASFIDPFMTLTGHVCHGPIVRSTKESCKICLDPMFKYTLDPQTINRSLESALGNAGMARDSFTPHQMRHAFCTYMLEAGVPLLHVSRMAGHSSVEITQRYIKTAEDPLSSMLRTVESSSQIVDVSRF